MPLRTGLVPVGVVLPYLINDNNQGGIIHYFLIGALKFSLASIAFTLHARGLTEKDSRNLSFGHWKAEVHPQIFLFLPEP